MSEKGIKMPHQIELKLLAIEMSEKGIRYPMKIVIALKSPNLLN